MLAKLESALLATPSRIFLAGWALVVAGVAMRSTSWALVVAGADDPNATRAEVGQVVDHILDRLSGP